MEAITPTGFTIGQLTKRIRVMEPTVTLDPASGGRIPGPPRVIAEVMAGIEPAMLSRLLKEDIAGGGAITNTESHHITFWYVPGVSVSAYVEYDDPDFPAHGKTYGDAVREDAPFAWWSLDETQGVFAADASGQENTLLYNPPVETWPARVPGPVSSSLARPFDPALLTSLSRLAYPPAFDALVTGPFSVEFWWQGPPQAAVLLDCRSDTCILVMVRLTAGGEMWVQRRNAARDEEVVLFGPAMLFDGDWHHVVFTVDSSLCTLYVDGQIVVADVTPVGAFDLAGPFGIGSNARAPQEYVDGVIDEVAFYNVALSPARIALHSLRRVAAPPPVVTRTFQILERRHVGERNRYLELLCTERVS